jgi:hypothetical protein
VRAGAGLRVARACGHAWEWEWEGAGESRSRWAGETVGVDEWEQPWGGVGAGEGRCAGPIRVDCEIMRDQMRGWLGWTLGSWS